MSTRKIKDAKDLETNELIYLRGHAKATYMSDGQTVEDAITNIQTGGGITTETDPIFSASPAAKITDENISSWNNKVDKVDGKQLSTEDFTTLLKQKLDSLSNYDDTEISQAVSKLRTDLDTLVSGDTTNAIKTFNEVIAFLDGISDTEDLSSIIASIEQQIAAKAGKSEIPTKVSQLENDEGYLASHQDISHLATKDDLQSKADDASVVHKTGDETISGAKTFNSGVNFLGNGDSNAVTLSTNTRINVNGTNHTVLGFASGSFYISHGNYNLNVRGKASRPAYNGSDMALLSDVNVKQDEITDLQTIREGAAKGATAIQSHQDISGKLDKTEAASTYLTKTDAASTYLGKTAKAASATSADSATKATQDGSGNVITSTYATKTELNGKGTYSKPSTGIPKSDLASAVQTSLGKADTALQSYTEQYKGTVTGIKVNGSTKTPSSGTVDIGNVVTGVKINGSTKSPSSGTVDLGTVITAHQDISGKQDKLVSGTNIKTINGQSLLGSGNITISEGGGSSSSEDIRYFTDFTVEQFIEGCENENVILRETSELFNAIKNNKIICVPYEGYDRGFLIASYKGGESTDYPDVFLQIGNILYHAYTGDFYELAGEMPSNETINVVEREGDEVVNIEAYDNTIYIVSGSTEGLAIYMYDKFEKGVVIRFTSGTDTAIGFPLEVKWANGVIPTIEPNTHYELSLVSDYDYVYAVLTPFY